MKYLIPLAILLVIVYSCSNTKSTASKQDKSYWKKVDDSKIPENYTKYQVFSLNEKAFLTALENGKIMLPDDNGNFNSFIVEESSTMSPELAAKFPEIKAYKGIQENNELCKTRIEKNKTKFKISVFCNDKTYFIDKDKSTNLFIVYNKANAPSETGVVIEK